MPVSQGVLGWRIALDGSSGRGHFRGDRPGGFVLIWVRVPTLSAYRLVAFITCMFAVTGAAVTAGGSPTRVPRRAISYLRC